MPAAALSDSLGSSHSSERMAAIAVVGAMGVLATTLTAWAVSRSPILVNAEGTAIWRSLVVTSYVGVGSYTWWRRPGSRLGPLLVGNGFLYALTSFNAS